MAEKRTLKVIEEDFEGLDYKASDLRKNLSFLRKADNANYSICDGVTKRQGHEAIGSPGLLLGTATYSYLDRVTGETKEELLGFGCHAFRLKEYSFSFYSTAAHGLGCYSRFRENGLGQREFVVYDQQSDLIIFTYTLTDTDDPFSNNIYSLCVALTTAGFTVTLPERMAVVQSNVSGGNGVDTIIPFSVTTTNFGQGQFYTVFNRATGLLEYVYLDYDAMLPQAQVRREYGWSYKTGDVWGSGAANIGSITGSGTGAGTSGSPLVIPFRYWEGIPWSYYQGRSKSKNTAVDQDYLAGIFEESLRASYAVANTPAWNYLNNSFSKYPTIQGINANNKFYFCNLWDTRGSDESISTATGAPNIPNSQLSTSGKPFCYDGRYVYRAGIFSPIKDRVYVSPSVTNGQWKYIITISYLDNNGVEWESAPSDAVANNTGGTGAGTQVGYNLGVAREFEWQTGYGYFDTRSGLVRTAAAPTTVLEVSGSTAGIGIPNVAIGDEIYWVSNNASTAIAPIPIKRTIVATNFNTAPYTITMDSALPYTANVGEAFSTGLFFNIYRTKQYGNIFYLIKKLPVISGAIAGVAYYITDQIADSALEIEYVEPLSGEEHDIPPSGKVITSHQGNLVIGGAPGEPNTVHWSGIDGIEYFPRAFNSADIPSTVKGAITAIYSDTDDRLAVFKDRGYYEVNGDLATKAISVVIKNEGDYGISSQLSLQRVNGVTIGVGEKGVILVNNGQVLWELMTRINPLIESKIKSLDTSFVSNLQPKLAVAINDYQNSQYILHIPSNYPLDPNALTLVYNYQRDKWTSISNDNVIFDFSGGMTFFENNLYMCSYLSITQDSLGDPTATTIPLSNNTTYMFQSSNATIFGGSNRWGGQLFRRKDLSSIIVNGQSLENTFNDFGSAYNFNVITSFESLGEPSAFKEFDLVRVWFVPPTVLSGTTSITTSNVDINMQGSSATLKTFADWNFTSKVSEVTKTLTGYIDTPYIDLNLRDKQARSLALQILNTDKNAFGITAIEYVYSTPYSSEANKKYGY